MTEVAFLDDARRRRDATAGKESWLTKQQIAAHLQFSTRWVDERVRAGMPCERWGGQRRFRVTDVEQWLTRHNDERNAAG